MSLIKQKCDLALPYAGAFLKKNDNNEADVITNLDDIYNIGTFVQITEFQEFNNRMRLIIQGHRRCSKIGLKSLYYKNIKNLKKQE
uniref:Lon N-terminal domain-containing protein n=1 Tax=Amphimedon queenslandica TaxID=400682 RepID=A0A1X7SDE9_AMPQE